jgi:malonate transporter and related proteins
MPHMAAVLAVTFPFFALVLCGYLAAWRRMLPLEAVPGLNGFVLFFALPCMLFRFGAGAPISQLLNPGTFLTWLLCALIMVSFSIAVTLNQRVRWNDASFGALVAAFPNSGFMGVPLLVALMGKAAAATVIVTITVDMIVTTSLCLALSRLDGAGEDGRQSASAAAKQALRGMLSNPMPWAIVAGAVFSFLELELWAPLGKTVALLAEAASPVALFTIGAVLARSQIQQQEQNKQETDRPMPAPRPSMDYIGVAAIKLFLHPIVVLILGAGVVSLGLAMDKFTLTVIVLVAALPSASNVSLLAERYGADNGRVARIILVSTALAFFTFSAAVSLLT